MGLNVRRDPLCLIQLSSDSSNAHIVQFDRNNYDAQNAISYATSAFALSHTKFGDVNILNDDEIEDFKINSIKNVKR